jgi:hypothetical protein
MINIRKNALRKSNENRSAYSITAVLAELTPRKINNTRLFGFRKLSRLAGGAEKPSWRDFWKVHPAANVFPLMPPDELRKLAADIDKNGLKVSIQTRAVAGEAAPYVIDGRNRLDAMELLGWEIVNEKGEWHGALAIVPETKLKVEHLVGYTHKQITAEVIGYNIHRRHLTKQGQVELIGRALKAVTGVFRHDGEELSPVSVGRPKDEHKAAVIKEAAKAGISKRTVERQLAKPQVKPRKPKPPPDTTSEAFFTGRFNRWLDYWPVSQHRVIRRGVLGLLIGRYDDKIKKVILPVSVIYGDGKKIRLADMKL